ncbi:hypothetical protein [Burkholderia dolosa]|nr:hypothetical protein [Burkholderia dolosa]MDN7419875.1 hypothetical protein [Burkholderia dolosa]
MPAAFNASSAASVCSGLRELWHASTIVVIPASSDAAAVSFVLTYMSSGR